MARRRQRIRTDKDRERDRRQIANLTEAQREKKRQQSRKYKATQPRRILISDAKRRAKRAGVEFDPTVRSLAFLWPMAAMALRGNRTPAPPAIKSPMTGAISNSMFSSS